MASQITGYMLHVYLFNYLTKRQWPVLLDFSVGNPLVTGEFLSQWTINEDMRTKSWWLSSHCVIIHKSSKICTIIWWYINNDKRWHQKKTAPFCVRTTSTSLRLMGNIHPNSHSQSLSEMLWPIISVNIHRYINWNTTIWALKCGVILT